MDELTVRFLDSSMKVKAICTDIVSLRFSGEFCGAGEFECVLPASAADVPEPDEYVLCGDGLIFVAERVSRSSITGEISVRGRGILSLLSRRIVPRGFMQIRSVENEACDLVRHYARSLFPAPLDIAVPTAGPSAQLVVEAGDLYERVTHLVSSVQKGVSLRWDGVAGRFEFAVFEGVDRRLANAVGNDPAFLSEGFGTIGGVSRVIDRSKYLNRVTVRGSLKSDGTVYMTSVNAEDYTFPDGRDDSTEPLREGYVKSGIGVSMFTSVDESGERVFDRDGYYAALRERGRQELALHRISLTLEASLLGGGGGDVDVGDVCTLSTPVSDVSVVRVIKKEYEYKNGRAKCTVQLQALA